MNNAEQISPPHSISAEQAVLGGLMLDNDRWDDIATIVSADRFYSRPHGVIFLRCRRCYFRTNLSI